MRRHTQKLGAESEAINDQRGDGKVQRVTQQEFVEQDDTSLPDQQVRIVF